MTKVLAAMAAALTLAACATVDLASAPQVQVSEPRPLNGMAGSAVDVTVSNRGQRPIARTAVACRFFDAAGAEVNTAATFFGNLAVGASDTNAVIVPSLGVSRSDCAVRP
jgi:hypothetical protein